MKRLGATLFVHNGISQDYCFEEAVSCLKALADEVIVLDAGSTDGTDEIVKTFADEKTKVILCSNEEWEAQKGKEKLNYFTNKAISELTTPWNFNLQADEILHEQSFKKVREAIELDRTGFMCRRFNLWGTPYHYLDVSHYRLPCSDYVMRLGRSTYPSYGDGESLAIPEVCTDFIHDIRIYHMGFVRDRVKMVKKIWHMQEKVFEVGHDVKIDGMELFDPWAWFTPTDIKPVEEQLPVFIQSWAHLRNSQYNQV